MKDEIKNLHTAIVESQAARDALFKAWRFGDFRKMLEDNLTESNPICESNDEDFPCLRCYRGTGYKISLASAWIPFDPGDIAVIQLDADYKGATVDSFDEAEGCPGAPVKTIRHELHVPVSLLRNPNNIKSFNAWANTERARQRNLGKSEAVEEVLALIRKHHLSPSDIRG